MTAPRCEHFGLRIVGDKLACPNPSCTATLDRKSPHERIAEMRAALRAKAPAGPRPPTPPPAPDLFAAADVDVDGGIL